MKQIHRLLALCMVTTALSAPAAAVETSAEYRYELAKNRLHILEGKKEAAVLSLKKLERLAPYTDKSLLVATINTCLAAPCGDKGWQAVRDLKRLYGKDKDSLILLKRWQVERGSKIGGSMGLAESGKARRETLGSITADTRLNDHLKVGMNGQLSAASLKGIVDGKTGQIRDDEILAKSAELYAEGSLSDRYSGKTQVFLGTNSVGFGGVLRREDYHGALQLSAAWRQPNWDYTELLLKEGTRDRILLTREHTITPSLKAEVRGGVAQYHLGNFRAADSLLLQGALSYKLNDKTIVSPILGEKSAASVKYTVDGEYAGDRNQRLTVNGQAFTPLPLTTRELHSVTLTASKMLPSEVVMEGFAGYSVDRFGGSAPLMGIAVGKNLHGLYLSAEASRSLNTSGSGGDTYTYTGLRANWVY